MYVRRFFFFKLPTLPYTIINRRFFLYGHDTKVVLLIKVRAKVIVLEFEL